MVEFFKRSKLFITNLLSLYKLNSKHNYNMSIDLSKEDVELYIINNGIQMWSKSNKEISDNLATVLAIQPEVHIHYPLLRFNSKPLGIDSSKQGKINFILDDVKLSYQVASRQKQEKK